MHIDPLPVSECGRLVGDASKESVMDSLRKDKDTRMSQYVYTEFMELHVLTWCCRRIIATPQEGLSASRKGGEERSARSVLL